MKSAPARLIRECIEARQMIRRIGAKLETEMNERNRTRLLFTASALHLLIDSTKEQITRYDEQRAVALSR